MGTEPSTFLPNLQIADLFDIAIVAVLLYLLLLALKQTRTTFVIVGAAILAATFVVAISLDLRLTRYVLQLVFAASLLGLLVMFHEELRVAAERFLSWRVRWRRNGASPDAAARDAATDSNVDILITTLTDLARTRIGALIVLPGRDNPSRFVRGGASLDGLLSESLLKSIFDPHSLGHDGALLLVGNRVQRFGCHLPLSTNTDRLGKRGTRHAAALGLSEKTDSLCLVVSEERGKISVARNGDLQEIDDPLRLGRILSEFYNETSPARAKTSLADVLLKHAWLKLASVIVAAVLWYFVVHESSTVYRTFVVAPTPVGVRDGLTATLDPDRLRFVVSGPRRSFYFRKPEHFGIDVKLFERGPGMYDIYLTATDTTIPEGLTFVNIAPTRSVKATIVSSPPASTTTE